MQASPAPNLREEEPSTEPNRLDSSPRKKPPEKHLYNHIQAQERNVIRRQRDDAQLMQTEEDLDLLMLKPRRKSSIQDSRDNRKQEKEPTKSSKDTVNIASGDHQRNDS